VALRPWIAAQIGGGPAALSLALTAFSVGIFLAVILIGSLGLKRRRGLVAFGGIAAAGCCMFGLAWAVAPWQLASLELILGAAVMVYGILWEAILQEVVPPEKMGRIAAIDEFGRMLLYPAGLAVVGMLAERWGAAPVMAGGRLLTAFLAGVGLLSPWVRQS
jgi:MFS family permease